MEARHAASILTKLALGKDPENGQDISEAGQLRTATVRFAVLMAIDALLKPNKNPRSGEENSGQPWSEADKKKAIDAYQKGAKFEEIAKEMRRSPWAIVCALRNSGLVSTNGYSNRGPTHQS